MESWLSPKGLKYGLNDLILFVLKIEHKDET